eukprot:s754_g23.t1
MVRRVPGCLHVVCAIWALSFQTKSQVVETVEIEDSSNPEKQQAILAKAPKDVESATLSNGPSLEVSEGSSALPSALPRALRSLVSAQSDHLEDEIGLGGAELEGLEGLEAQKSRRLESIDSKTWTMDFGDSNNLALADLASQNMQVLMEEI